MPNSYRKGTPESSGCPQAGRARESVARRPEFRTRKTPAAGDPPEFLRTTQWAQVPGGSNSSNCTHGNHRPRLTEHGLMPAALLLGLLVTLILSQLLYALRRWGGGYPAVLLLTAVGIALGQAWRLLDLPGLALGDLNLVPGVLFAILLRPLASRLPIRFPRRPPGASEVDEDPDEV